MCKAHFEQLFPVRTTDTAVGSDFRDIRKKLPVLLQYISAHSCASMGAYVSVLVAYIL